MATARRHAHTPLRGRTTFALGLVLFMSVTALVIWRRSTGVALVREGAALETQLASLRSDRALLERNLRDAMSSQRVVPEAERRLGMHVATEVQTRTLAEPAGVP